MLPLLLLALLPSPARGQYRTIINESGVLSSPTALFTALLDAATLGAAQPGINPASPQCKSRADYAALLPPGWAVSQGPDPSGSRDALVRNWTAPDFRAAFAFMAGVAVLADANNHHPLWSNVYNFVGATLNTDDKPCVSDLDFALARGMDDVWALVVAQGGTNGGGGGPVPFLDTAAGKAAVGAPVAAAVLVCGVLAASRLGWLGRRGADATPLLLK